MVFGRQDDYQEGCSPRRPTQVPDQRFPPKIGSAWQPSPALPGSTSAAKISRKLVQLDKEKAGESGPCAAAEQVGYC